jgi:AraC-like DNA-binding protein
MSEQILPSYDLDRGDELALPFTFLRLEQTRESYNPTEPHRHNYYEIFYFLRGAGEHDIDFRTYPIRDNSIHFISPGQVHQVRRSPESHGYILLFTAEFYAVNLGKERIFAELPFMSQSSPNPVLLLSEHQQSPFLETIKMFEAELRADRAHREEMLRAYLNIFLVHARRLFEETARADGSGSPAHELIDRLRILIEHHFTTIHAAGAYAEMLSVSQNHLNTTVRKLLGRTIGDLVHERIILEAKRLLFHTELSVKEIAFGLNYDDPSYFTRFFRRHAGISPQEFREASRKKHR